MPLQPRDRALSLLRPYKDRANIEDDLFQGQNGWASPGELRASTGWYRVEGKMRRVPRGSIAIYDPDQPAVWLFSISELITELRMDFVQTSLLSLL